MGDTIWNDLTGGFTAVPMVISFSRMVAAVVLGALIGIEREYKQKPAGLRTHMLVSLAACLFVLTGLEIAQLEFGRSDALRVDPLRLIEAVTAGVAFLAAGLIFKSGDTVRNVTTGASLWLAGAIGLACGSGHIPLAGITAVLVVIVLFIVGRVERAAGTHYDE